MVFLMVFYIFGVSLYIVMYESVESPNLFQYNRSVIKNEVLNYKWPCRLLLRLKIPHKICDQMTFKKWKRWGFQLAHSPSGQYRLTVNIRLAALLRYTVKQKQKPLVVAVHECLATAEPELQTTAVQFCMQQQRLHGKTTQTKVKKIWAHLRVNICA